MAQEAMNAVLDAERKARELLSAAKTQAAEVAERSEAEAKAQAEALVRAAEKQAEDGVEAARTAAEAAAQEKLDEAGQVAARYASLSDAALQPAIEYVVKEVLENDRG